MIVETIRLKWDVISKEQNQKRQRMLTIIPMRTGQISTKEKTIVSNMLRRENCVWEQ